MSGKTLVSLFLGAAAAGFAMRAVIAQDYTTYPGQPTQGKVWIQNRGDAEAIPVTVQGGSPAQPLRVFVVGTPPMTLGSDSIIQSRAGRQQWEYQSVAIPRGQDPALMLNSAGGEGWEAVGITLNDQERTLVVMKRPK